MHYIAQEELLSSQDITSTTDDILELMSLITVFDIYESISRAVIPIGFVGCTRHADIKSHHFRRG